jgi:hypothetical protein
MIELSTKVRKTVWLAAAGALHCTAALGRVGIEK